MGDKYLPTKKGLKAEKRFQQSLHTQSKFIKPVTKPAASTKPKKK